MKAKKRSHEEVDEKAPVFIQTLYALLADCDGEVCRWSEDGRHLVIADPARFAADVCPTRFRHRNFASFTRLLNMYGFHKVPASSADGKRVSFAHADFVRGREDLLLKIQRKTTANADGGDHPRTGVEALVNKDVWAKANQEIDEIQKRMRTETTSVSTWMRKVIDLEREVKQLREDNARLREMEVEKAQLYGQLASQNEVIVNLIASQLQQRGAAFPQQQQQQQQFPRDDDDNNDEGHTTSACTAAASRTPSRKEDGDLDDDDDDDENAQQHPIVTPSQSLDFDHLPVGFHEDNPSDEMDVFGILDDHDCFDD